MDKVYKVCVIHGRVQVTKRTKKCPYCDYELDETDYQERL